jgi:hypothetical protein
MESSLLEIYKRRAINAKTVGARIQAKEVVPQTNLYEDTIKLAVGFPATHSPVFTAGFEGHAPQTWEDAEQSEIDELAQFRVTVDPVQ